MAEHNLHNAVQVKELELERDRLVEQLKGMEKIRTRIAQLETIIKTWKDVIEAEQPQSPQEKLFPEIPRRDSLEASLIEMPHNERITLILKENGHLMSINEIASEYRKRHWKLSEENASAILGRILRKRTDLFIRQTGEKGLTAYYGLKEN